MDGVVVTVMVTLMEMMFDGPSPRRRMRLEIGARGRTKRSIRSHDLQCRSGLSPCGPLSDELETFGGLTLGFEQEEHFLATAKAYEYSLRTLVLRTSVLAYATATASLY